MLTYKKLMTSAFDFPALLFICMEKLHIPNKYGTFPKWPAAFSSSSVPWMWIFWDVWEDSAVPPWLELRQHPAASDLSRGDPGRWSSGGGPLWYAAVINLDLFHHWSVSLKMVKHCIFPRTFPNHPLKSKFIFILINSKIFQNEKILKNCAIMKVCCLMSELLIFWCSILMWRSDLCTLHTCFVPIVVSHFLSADVTWSHCGLNPHCCYCV